MQRMERYGIGPLGLSSCFALVLSCLASCASHFASAGGGGDGPVLSSKGQSEAEIYWESSEWGTGRLLQESEIVAEQFEMVGVSPYAYEVPGGHVYAIPGRGGVELSPISPLDDGGGFPCAGVTISIPHTKAIDITSIDSLSPPGKGECRFLLVGLEGIPSSINAHSLQTDWWLVDTHFGGAARLGSESLGLEYGDFAQGPHGACVVGDIDRDGVADVLLYHIWQSGAAVYSGRSGALIKRLDLLVAGPALAMDAGRGILVAAKEPYRLLELSTDDFCTRGEWLGPPLEGLLPTVLWLKSTGLVGVAVVNTLADGAHRVETYEIDLERGSYSPMWEQEMRVLRKMRIVDLGSSGSVLQLLGGWFEANQDSIWYSNWLALESGALVATLKGSSGDGATFRDAIIFPDDSNGVRMATIRPHPGILRRYRIDYD